MSDTESKTDPASDLKLKKQREKGSIPSGSEVAGLLACAVGLLVLASIGSSIWNLMSRGILDVATLMDAPVGDILEVGLALLGQTIFYSVAPLVGIIFATGILTSLLYNGGFVFSMHPVKPQLSRLSMKNGFTRIYGRRGWMEFGVSSVRLIVWFLIAGFIGMIWLPSFLKSPDCGLECTIAILHPLAWIILVATVVIMLTTSAIEAIIQRNQFLHEQKMTKSEVQRERKDQHGSNEIRQERRRVQQKSKEPYSKPGLGRGNMMFYAEGKAVLIRYLPPEEQEAYIVAKVSGEEAVTAARDKIRRPGVHEAEEPVLLSRLWSQELGDQVASQHLPILAAAMRRMLSQ